jgi:hypothetical protein
MKQTKKLNSEKKAKPATEPKKSAEKSGADESWRRYVATEPPPASLRRALEGTYVTFSPGLFGAGPTTMKISDYAIPLEPKRRSPKKHKAPEKEG